MAQNSPSNTPWGYNLRDDWVSVACRKKVLLFFCLFVATSLTKRKQLWILRIRCLDFVFHRRSGVPQGCHGRMLCDKKKFCLFSCSLLILCIKKSELSSNMDYQRTDSLQVQLCVTRQRCFESCHYRWASDRTYLYVFHTCDRRSRSSKRAGWRCCKGFWAPHWKMGSQAEPGPLLFAVLMFQCTCRNLWTYKVESDTASRFSVFPRYHSWPPGGVYYSIFLIHVKIITVESATEVQQVSGDASIFMLLKEFSHISVGTVFHRI